MVLSKKAIIAISVPLGVVALVGLSLLIAYFAGWRPIKSNNQMDSTAEPLQIVRADTYLSRSVGLYVTDIEWTSPSNGEDFVVSIIDETTKLILNSRILPPNMRQISMTSSLNYPPPYLVKLEQSFGDNNNNKIVLGTSVDVEANGPACATASDCTNGSVCSKETKRCVCNPEVRIDRLFIMSFTNGTVVAWHDYRTDKQMETVKFECNLYHNGKIVESAKDISISNFMFNFKASDVNDLRAEARATLACGSTAKWSFMIGERYTLSYPNERCSVNCICAFGYCANSQFDCPYPIVDGLMFSFNTDYILISVPYISTVDVPQRWKVTLESTKPLQVVDLKNPEPRPITPITRLVTLEPATLTTTTFVIPFIESQLKPGQLGVRFVNLDAVAGSPCAEPMIITRIIGCGYGSIYPFESLSIKLKPSLRPDDTIIHVAAVYMQEDLIINTIGNPREFQFDETGNGNVQVVRKPLMKDVQNSMQEPSNMRDPESAEVAEEIDKDGQIEDVPATEDGAIAVTDEEVVAEDGTTEVTYEDIMITEPKRPYVKFLLEFWYNDIPVGNVVLERADTDVELVVSGMPCNNPSAMKAIMSTLSSCPEPTSMSLDIGFIIQACPAATAKAIATNELLVERLFFIGDRGTVKTSWVGWSAGNTTVTLFYNDISLQTIQPDPDKQSVEFQTDFIAPQVYINVSDLSVQFFNKTTLQTHTKIIYQCISIAIMRPSNEVSRYLAELAPTEDTWWSFYVHPAKTEFDFAEIHVLSNTDRPVSQVTATYFLFGDIIGVDDVMEDEDSFFILPYRFQNCRNPIATGIIAQYETIGSCYTIVRNKQVRLGCMEQFESKSAALSDPLLADIVFNPFEKEEATQLYDGIDPVDSESMYRPVVV
jgi:hypothetical protein